jgi:hypothetical protein
MISRSSLFEYAVGALFFAAVGFSLGQTGVAGNGLLALVPSSGCSATITYANNSGTPFFKDTLASTTNVTMGVFNVTPDEAVTVTSFAVTITGPLADFASSTANLTLWDGASQIGNATVTVGGSSVVNIPVGFLDISGNTTKVLTLKANLAAIPPAIVGDKLIANITGIDAYTVRNSLTAIVTGSTNFSGISLHTGIPTITLTTPTVVLANGTNVVASTTINVPAGHSSVKMEKLVFDVTTVNASTTSFSLYGPNGNVSSTTALKIAGTSKYIVYFDNPSNTTDRTIASNTTVNYAFKVAGLTLNGPGGTGSVTTKLKADASYQYGRVGYQSDSKSNQNVVWSADPAQSATIWANSYGLPGCFRLK